MKNGKQQLLIAGSGFLSGYTANGFEQRNWKVRILTRRPERHTGAGVAVPWDAASRGDWETALQEADVLINFCGRSVNCRYHAENRRMIRESRVAPTRILGRAMADASRPPRVWINAASATVYRHAEDRGMDEVSGEPGTGFSVDVCRAWEDEALRWRTSATRQVLLRTSMVLGHRSNSIYPTLARLASLGLAGPMGPGSQFISWIHVDDFCRALEFLADGSLAGPVNITSPEPVTNRYFMRTLRDTLGIRLGLPASRWMLECGAMLMRTETELILKSRRIVPRRLAEADFTWRHPTLPEALKQLAERP